ncbi:amino acid ABC transporter substrate-binding protein [Aeribacillus alveayuensis]|uniref:Cystine transport system substrate-binding protein n=1 Tax=Aeribacillus alveayuensis TaxID=279215 RepID=A0ABT9VPN9_9BACI|nr:cystine transport system substrate-binding protein [Bacillus alveayuensis]
MKKIFLTIFVITSIIFSLAACGTANENSQEEKLETAEGENLYDKIKEEGGIRVGTEGTYPPFTFHDENGELTGYDVEVAKEVAKRLGLEVEFKETQWDAMFAGLNSKRFDMIANQVGIKPERVEKYDFSIPYTVSTAVVVVQKDNNDIQSFEDLNGKKAAQSLTSNYGELAKANGAELVGVEGFNQAIELITSNRVDATINDKLSVLDYMKQKPDAPIKIVAESDDAAESAFMFRKGNEELVEAVNEVLEEMKQDGTLAKLSEKWFGEDVSE